MNAAEAYKRAHRLHYEDGDLDAARAGYEEVVRYFPGTPEAGYAQTQLDNIESDNFARPSRPSDDPLVRHLVAERERWSKHGKAATARAAQIRDELRSRFPECSVEVDGPLWVESESVWRCSLFVAIGDGPPQSLPVLPFELQTESDPRNVVSAHPVLQGESGQWVAVDGVEMLDAIESGLKELIGLVVRSSSLAETEDERDA